jgi:ABC-2 type transport system ATP-binding protein
MPTEGAAAAARARGVSRVWPGGVAALTGVDLDLPRGAVTALVGANGAGKTTLLRIFAALVEPSAGTVEVLGVAEPAAARRLSPSLRRRLGYVPQEPALDPEMTGAEILSLLAALHGLGGAERRRRVAELAEAFGAASHLRRRVGTFSGGLKRRLHLAAGMIHDPELLLLDEPTTGLDPEGQEFLWEELTRRARAGRAVAVVTHDLAAAEARAQQVAILEAGALVAAGSPRELVAATPPDLAAAFRRATGRDPAALALRGRAGEP